MTKELVFCLVVAVVLMLCVVILLWQHLRLRGQYIRIQESFKQLEQLNFELRAARHDYLNHMQVVYGMLELEDYEELRTYVEPVYKDIMKTGKALKTSKPALNALLKAKMQEAEGKQIDVYVEVKSDLGRLRIEDWQLCKVLSNLIDNAMTALEHSEGEKKIEIDINENKDVYQFVVANNGPVIPKEQLPLIFKRGFSTKKEDGHGIGLAIVTDIVKNNAGAVEVMSKENETAFTITFRKGE